VNYLIDIITHSVVMGGAGRSIPNKNVDDFYSFDGVILNLGDLDSNNPLRCLSFANTLRPPSPTPSDSERRVIVNKGLEPRYALPQHEWQIRVASWKSHIKRLAISHGVEWMMLFLAVAGGSSNLTGTGAEVWACFHYSNTVRGVWVLGWYDYGAIYSIWDQMLFKQ
jgi:hypothetical protein